MSATQIETGKALKDAYSPSFVRDVAKRLSAACVDFDRAGFEASVLDATWPNLEFKGRMLRLAEGLDCALPHDFPAALTVVDAWIAGYGDAERQGADRTTTTGFDALLGLFVPSFVERRAARDIEAHWDLAMEALARYTPHASAEFAVRPFLIHDQARALVHMLTWTQSPNEHVRRLASEGCRPRLPWAMSLPALKRDPTPLLPLLIALRDDPSEYVRRSVANNLNDLAKDHPAFVVELATEWLRDAPSAERRRLVKHALRTRLKRGDPRALQLFGFGDPSAIDVVDLTLERDRIVICTLRSKPTAENQIEFAFTLAHSKGQPLGRLRVEYAIHFVKANGKQLPKVFQLTEFESADSTRAITRTHAFVDLTTRTHYPGRHVLTILVNGVERARVAFDLRG